ncbi:MAG: thiamine-phosphate kinase [Candidatus Eremiobacteraeota bacterium]|uniref:Putative thiamin-monophosphate kinase n=1 Tax=mine drainage metagenome TaxID=410659 RepID=E6PJ50_9ZZZZ|nr:thiamine-phosphate kinase [Candidatus Eremiobacteraeota bacterium]
MALSENATIAAIREELGEAGRPRIELGIGDDAALWQPSRSDRSAISTDAFVDGVHFRRGITGLDRIGARAIAASVSDLAAMGARPRLATIALGVPSDISLDEIRSLYRGIARAARELGIAVAGGDCTASPVLTLAVTVVGEVRASHVRRRDGARLGDTLAVTGPLGASAAGLRAIEDPNLLEEPLRRSAIDAYELARARIPEGRWLAASSHVRAMIDCSDGLGRDCARIATASGVGILLEYIPVAPEIAALARVTGEDAEELALAGGEDYELIVAIATPAFAHLQARFRKRFGRELIAVGRCDAQAGVRWWRSGSATPVDRYGWDHFEVGEMQ